MDQADIDALHASVLKDDFYEFFQEFWHVTNPGEPLKLNWHIKYLCDVLQDVGNRIVNREPAKFHPIFNIPPGETKSNVCSISWPPWLMAKDPSIQTISGSYDRTLAIRLAMKSKDIMTSDLYKRLYPATKVRKDMSAKVTYMTTMGGGRQAVGSGSAITGSHAHVHIIDDPIDPKGVKSEAVMKKVNNWIKHTLPSRFVNSDNAVTVLVMQRLATGDPTDLMLELKKEKAAHICLPATDDYPVKPASARKYYVDGLMNPLRQTKESLEALRRTLGPIEYPTQYGQSPGSFEGNIIKRHYFTKADKEPQDESSFWVIDTNLKGSTGTDPIGCLRFKYDRDTGMVYLCEYWSESISSPELVKRLTEDWNKHAGERSRMFIEPKSSGPAITEFLKLNNTIRVGEYKMPANAGKADRLAAILPQLDTRGCYYIPSFGMDSFIEVCCAFPNVKHDEAVDCLTMTFDMCYGTKISNPRQWRMI